jgi:protein-S-isoprenylcysteine O-methyltransferase Ste14
MKELAFLWPIILTAIMLSARIWELRRKFAADPGKILAPTSFRNMVSVGTGSVLLCVAEYILRGSPPRLLWVSGAGALLGASTFVLRGFSRKALSRMWSVHVEIRERHTLVQTGPYARIRHPIYLGTVLEVIAAALLLNAWLAGALGLVATGLVLRRRIRVEERAMEEKFGDEWRRYCLRAGLLWPWP